MLGWGEAGKNTKMSFRTPLFSPNHDISSGTHCQKVDESIQFGASFGVRVRGGVLLSLSALLHQVEHSGTVGACWVSSCFHNSPNSDMDYRIVYVRTFLCVRIHTGGGHTDNESAQQF